MKSIRTAAIVFFVFLTAGLFSQNSNLSQGLLFDGEPYLAIDPLNNSHLVVAWMGWIPFQQISIKTRTTFDGGQTWSPVQSIPHASPGFTSADPSLALDHLGRIYLAYVDYRQNPDSGAVYVMRSTDGGLNWDQRRKVIDAWDDGLKKPIDRPWLTIDRSGGIYSGNMYVTTKPAPWIPTPNRPYFIRSTDAGQNWDPWRYLDTLNWLVGPYIAGPMAAPVTGPDGTFYAIYPSWELSQSLMPRFLIARSSDGGSSFDYHPVSSGATGIYDTLSKKGYQLIVDPSDSAHLAFLSISSFYGDPDIILVESHDFGISWADTTRINDDPAGNERMQELAWAGFSPAGDLVAAWRDRRNAPDTGYATSYEIWGAVRWHDSLAFSPNFRISDTIVAFDQVLMGKGNDFMNVVMAEDTMSAVWGDTRNGLLSIWFQRMDLRHPNTSGIRPVASETAPWARFGPNPANNFIWVEAPGLTVLSLYDLGGKRLKTKFSGDTGVDAIRCMIMQVSDVPPGAYVLEVSTTRGALMQKIIVTH